jgi:hypothetical protein
MVDAEIVEEPKLMNRAGGEDVQFYCSPHAIVAAVVGGVVGSQRGGESKRFTFSAAPSMSVSPSQWFSRPMFLQGTYHG